MSTPVPTDSTVRIEWQAQEFVEGHWLPVLTLADRPRVLARFEDMKRVHRPAMRTFRLVRIATVRTVEVEIP